MIRRPRRDGSLSPPRRRSEPPWTVPGGREDENVTSNKTPYQDLCHSLEEARKRSRDYRSDCVFFASQFARQLVEHLGGPRDLVSFEPTEGARMGDGPVTIEEAMHLDEDTYWHLGMRIRLESDKASDEIALQVRFKKIEKLFVVNLFAHEDFEIAEPSPTALLPIFRELCDSVKRHYEDGLRLFLDNRGQNLNLPFTAVRQSEVAGER